MQVERRGTCLNGLSVHTTKHGAWLKKTLGNIECIHGYRKSARSLSLLSAAFSLPLGQVLPKWQRTEQADSIFWRPELCPITCYYLQWLKGKWQEQRTIECLPGLSILLFLIFIHSLFIWQIYNLLNVCCELHLVLDARESKQLKECRVKEFLTYNTEFKRKFVFKLLYSKIDFFLLECTVLCILTCVDSCN